MEENDIELKDIADDLLILNKVTIDKLFQLDNAADCIALYILYYKTAKWQKTNQPKANDDYVKKCLKWGKDRIKNTKQTLKESGLIEIIQGRKNGKISGWFVKVSYIVTQKSIEDIKIKTINLDSNNTSNQQVDQSTNSNQNLNTLKENNKYLKKENNTNINISINENSQTTKNNFNNNLENEKPKKKQLTKKQKNAIEINKILEEFIKDEDKDIQKVLKDYVEVRKIKGLVPSQLQLILENFEKGFSNKSKSVILEQIKKATARGWLELYYEDNFKGTAKTTYSSKPTFDNTITHIIPTNNLEVYNKMTFEEKIDFLNTLPVADMTKEQKEFFNKNCLSDESF